MTRRDLVWRAAGAALCLGACALGLADRDGSPLALVYFLAAVAGIVLVLNGKRVGVALKAERRGHDLTATAVRARRTRRGPL